MHVAIIGGGIVGTSAAAFLAGEGVGVTVFEREGIASGASGRNSGVIQHPFDPALLTLYRDTVEIYRSLDLEAVPTGFRLDVEPAGLLLATPSLDTAEARARELARIHPHLAPEVLDAGALRRLEPSLAPGMTACRVGIGYPVVPSAPTYAMATLAERRGALIRQGRAASLLIEDGRCRGVIVEGRTIEADAVIVAAGPWTPDIVDPTGRWRPIERVWGVVVETLLADPPRHVIENAELDEALATDPTAAAGPGVGGEGRDPASAGHAPASAGHAHDPGSSSFSLVTAGGVSVVGSTFLDVEPDPAAWVEPLLAGGATYVPGIADAPIREVRLCARPTSRDGRPLIGALPDVQGLFVCAGHGPWGITTGPGSARLIADLVLSRAPEIPAALDAARFEPARA